MGIARHGQPISRKAPIATSGHYRIIAWTLLLGLLVPACSGCTNKAGSLAITAKASQPEYADGRDVAINVTLSNQGEACAAVTAPEIAMVATRVLLNGQPLPLDPVPVAYDLPAAELQKKASVSLEHNEAVTFPLGSDAPSGLGIFRFLALSSTEVDPSIVRLSTLTPGDYTLSIRYSPLPASDGAPGLCPTYSVKSTDVTFVVG
jgi:hypothetical protein